MAERYVRPEQHEHDTAARRRLASALPNEWVDRMEKGGDYGIDDEVEVLAEGRSTGLVLLLQRKGFDETPPDESIEELVFDLNVRTAHYAELFAVPVLLCLVPVAGGVDCFYYLWLQEYIGVVLDHSTPKWRDNKESVRVRVPTANRMPGDEARLAFIAGAPRRDRQWAIAARFAHELEYLVMANDLDRVRHLIEELRNLTAIFGVPGWTWSMWMKQNMLDTALSAVDALRRGPPYSGDDVRGAGSSYDGAMLEDGEEQWMLEHILRSKLELLGGRIGAALSTVYDRELARAVHDIYGDRSF
jgi:hypothetical protein